MVFANVLSLARRNAYGNRKCFSPWLDGMHMEFANVSLYG